MLGAACWAVTRFKDAFANWLGVHKQNTEFGVRLRDSNPCFYLQISRVKIGVLGELTCASASLGTRHPQPALIPAACGPNISAPCTYRMKLLLIQVEHDIAGLEDLVVFYTQKKKELLLLHITMEFGVLLILFAMCFLLFVKIQVICGVFWRTRARIPHPPSSALRDVHFGHLFIPNRIRRRMKRLRIVVVR